MKISSTAIVGLLLLASLASAQDSATLRPARLNLNPAVTAQALREPANVQTLQGEIDAKLQALSEQMAALKAENEQLKAKLAQLNAKVDGNQWNLTATVTNLQQSYKQHTHTYERTSINFNNVRIDDQWASYISGIKPNPATSSVPND